MKLIVVDVESDGPCPGLYSMVCFGAVVVEPGLTRTFAGKTKPISDKWDPEALAISGYSRNEHASFSEPKETMDQFKDWLNSLNDKPVFISDNLAYDWQFINYYFHLFCGKNPFGFSGRRIGDLYAGLYKDLRVSWKNFRKTKHDHNPVNDAKGNAEALLKLKELGIKGI